MRKDRQPRKEFTALQKANKEIKMLKRQLSRLKKLIARINIEEYQNIQEAKEAQMRERIALKKDIETLEDAERWRCFSCEEDYLRLVIYQKVDQPYYFRRCPSCGKRTKAQKFNVDIKGPLPDEKT